MRWIYIVVSLGAAFAWFSWAFGWVSYSPWVVTMAFIFLGIDCLIGAMKKFVEAA
jgi:hypothetical protein